MSVIETAELAERRADILEDILKDFNLLLDKIVLCSDIPDSMFGEVNQTYEKIEKIHKSFVGKIQ